MKKRLTPAQRRKRAARIARRAAERPQREAAKRALEEAAPLTAGSARRRRSGFGYELGGMLAALAAARMTRRRR